MKLRIVELKSGKYALEYHSPFFYGNPEGKWIRINKKLQEDEFESYETKSELIDLLEQLQATNVVFETEIEGVEVKKKGPHFGLLEDKRFRENTFVMPCTYNSIPEHNDYLEKRRKELELVQRGNDGSLF